MGGGLLLARGIVGLALDPAFETPGEGWHQLFHAVSALALLAASRHEGQALALALGFGAVYGAVAITGIASGNDVAGLIPIAASDNAVHVTLTVLALGAGLLTLLRARAASRPAL